MNADPMRPRLILNHVAVEVCKTNATLRKSMLNPCTIAVEHWPGESVASICKSKMAVFLQHMLNRSFHNHIHDGHGLWKSIKSWISCGNSRWRTYLKSLWSRGIRVLIHDGGMIWHLPKSSASCANSRRRNELKTCELVGLICEFTMATWIENVLSL